MSDELASIDAGGEWADRQIVEAPILSPEQQLIKLWLNRSASPHTRRYYARAWKMFRQHCPTPLERISLLEVQGFADYLARRSMRAGSQHAILAAVKSLFAFGARIHVVPCDVAAVIKLPAERDTLGERILSENEVESLIERAGNAGSRDRLLIETLYVCGLRESELTGLRWQDLVGRREGGQLTVFGKGRKTRAVLLPADLWRELLALRRPGTADDAPVFVSRLGRRLSESQVRRIVAKAARSAGIGKKVSPHWLRHCHASHALERGAKLNLVQATLGHASVATTSRYLHVRPEESSSSYLGRMKR